MPWLKSPLSQVIGLAVSMTLVLPLAALGARHHLLLAGAFTAITIYALPIALAHWVAADLRGRGKAPCFELPFLLLLAWPLSLFWYCIWTRGGWGLAMAAGLVLLSYLPLFTTNLFWFVWAAFFR
jgi:hypothetical protein